MVFNIGIVAHVSRITQAQKLMQDVKAEYMSIDNGNLGCTGNHRKVWRHLAKNGSADWFIVLEDDAIPVEGFRDQLEEALQSSPAAVISLYLGRLRPPQYQPFIEGAIRRADDADASWIVSREIIHAVGIAIRGDLVPEMLTDLDDQIPFDEAVSKWALKHRYRVAYAWPSLVDHADGETLLKHVDGARVPGRVAWRAEPRARWANEIVHMGF